MPKRKGETDQQWMERLRRFRDREALFDQVRAAKCYIGTINNTAHAEEVELAAFMAIFHPDRELLTSSAARQMLGKRNA